MIQLLHRTVHPTDPKAELTIDHVANQQHDELEPTTHSSQHASAALLDITELAKAPDSGPIWSLRHRAAHLWRSPHGIWYVRLVVPESIRREHPNLPAELRRTTKTSIKRVAEDFARKTCINFFVKYSKRENPMFGLDEKKNAFTVSYVDGALRAECTPDATPHTLLLMKQSVIMMIQSLGRGERLHSTTQVPPPLPPLAEVPIAPLAADPPTTMAETRHALTATSSPSASGHGIWLSDAIEDWHKNSGVKFSAETWEFAYETTFRVFRELVGDVRRVPPTSPTPDGAGQLDILVGSLTRQHVLRFYEQLKLLPLRQGKRFDGIEAPLRIAEARRSPQAPPSRGNIKKKLRHIAPFVVWCELKGYVDAEVLKEFKLAQKAASGSGGVGAEKAIARKPGYIAFAPTELKKIFEQPTYRTGAAEDDWRYWVPLLCLFNGLRVAEASQTHTGDLCIVDGVHCLRTATIEDEGEGEIDDVTTESETMTEDEYRRRLKNNASRRTVPIHPRLIELGFLDFVASLTTPDGETRHLFPCLPWHPKSLWGRKASEFMGTLIRKAGVYVKRKKVPHSLRSNFNQAVEKTGLQDALIQRLMGHSTGTMKDESYAEAEYGAAIPAALVHTHLQQTDFDLNLPTWHELVSWRRGPGTKH